DANAHSWGNNMLSVLSRVQYNYQEKDYASASFRRDASSRFSPETRWGNFWSICGAWNLKNESFLSNIDEIDMIKLKASYGTNGTLPDSNFGYMSLATFGLNYNGKPGGEISTIADRNLDWEN